MIDITLDIIRSMLEISTHVDEYTWRTNRRGTFIVFNKEQPADKWNREWKFIPFGYCIYNIVETDRGNY